MVMIAGVALSGIWLVIAIAIAVFLIWKLGKMILGFLLNTILGFITLFLINLIFGLGINYDLAAIIITAICGLPGAAAIILLKLLGISV